MATVFLIPNGGGGSSRARNERPNRLVTHPATPPVMFRGPAHTAGEEQPSFPPSDGSGTKPNKHHLRLPPQQRTWAGAGRSVSFSLFCGRAQSREEKTRLGYRVSASLRVERDGAGGFLFSSSSSWCRCRLSLQVSSSFLGEKSGGAALRIRPSLSACRSHPAFSPLLLGCALL
jgi:hypothetical protein